MGESVKKKTSSNQNIKKKTSGTASTGNRKPSTKAQREQLLKEEERAKAFQVEVILWVIVAVSLLLFISNFGVGGVVGGAVSGFLFGLFGLLEYVFPIILLLVSFFVVSNHGNRIAFFKLAATLVCIIFLDVLIALVTSSGDTMPTAIQAFQECFQNKIGGGLVGGGIGWLLYLAFGKIGAYIVTIAVLIICFVLVTEKSAMRGIRQRSSRVYQAAKDNYDSAVSEKARKPRRMECKVRGVGDTTIEEDAAQPSDNMNELHLNSSVELSKTLEEKMSRMADPTPFEPKFAENPNVDEKSARAEDLIRQMEDSFADSLPEPSIFQAPEEISEIVEEEPEVIEQTRRKPRSSEAEIQQSIAEVAEEIAGTTPVKEYVFPPLSLLKSTGKKKSGNSQNELRETAIKLQKTLQTFGVNVTVTDISCGPAVTRYEIQPEMGVKVSKIVNLADDIKLNLAAADIRIEAPIPGKAAVGIEVPNKENTMVSFRELIESKEFKESPSNITFAVGRDIAGNVKVADIAKMPHVLIAGATGSGKSVCINTIVMSILYKAKPEDVKMIMIDPKVVELSVYNGIPHLMIPVVTDPKKAAGALNWAVQEMLDRYDKFAEASVRKIDEYNAKIEKIQVPEGQEPPKKMPQLVIIVDELADLMMVASHEVEEAICRLAQLARAAGIHLVIATQRPSVNVITGLIKANMPSRIAFAVTSGIDSRTILDMNGAEKLLGKGDMLFNPQGVPKPLRVQGAFVSDEEVSAVVSFVSEQNGGAQYNPDVQQKMDTLQNSESQSVTISDVEPEDGRDAYFEEAGRIVVDKEKASIGMLQRYLKIGFNRAARIMDQLEEAGVVGPELGTKPRSVLMSSEDFQLFIDGNSQK